MTKRLPFLFAITTAALPMSDGGQVVVHLGEHWWAEDQVVKEHPGVFTDDPRYDLKFTGDGPPEMAVPPGEESPEQPSGRRSRTSAKEGG